MSPGTVLALGLSLAAAPDRVEQLRPNIVARHWHAPAMCEPFLEIAATDPCDYNNGAYHTARNVEIATPYGPVVLDWTEGGGCNARGEGPGDWLRIVAVPGEAVAIPEAVEIFEKGPEADRVGTVRVYAPYCGM